MSETFLISRSDLAPVFNNLRVVAQFEEMQRAVAENSETTGANVEATTALSNATFLTLSSNAELDNEFVFQVGEGLRIEASDGVARLFLEAPVLISGHSVRFTTSGDSLLALPVSGFLATREWINAAGPFADDAAASAGGVGLGEVYRRGDKLAARLT